jgi:23S rRNA (cytidine1920-2'-O)/16S rRNA (cytidine1409-2'-O)-methyltransferase
MKSKPHSQAGSKPRKVRLDSLLVERGLAPSLERARALLLAGKIQVEGQRVDKPGTQIANHARIAVLGQESRYASRGGRKLEGALKDFGIDPRGKVCVDIGSSTGGVTDCLLQGGAATVYAVDVSIDQLDWNLRQNERVVTLEQNARFLRPEDIPEMADLIVMDVSFISATKILPALLPIGTPDGDFVVLIKPQFELAKREVAEGGVVRDATLHEKAIQRVVKAASELQFEIVAVKPSTLPGAEGNQEFFLHARRAKVE